MDYNLESTVRFAIKADSPEKAIEVAKELMTSINDNLADALIHEWTDPVVIWSGSPDPLDPDNFWIDDNTNERVNASTGERLPSRPDVEFAGYHKFRALNGTEYGSFEVFNTMARQEGSMELKEGWYWWPCQPGCIPDNTGEPANGPFPTAEGAYLDAMEGGQVDITDNPDTGFLDEFNKQNPELNEALGKLAESMKDKKV